MGWGHPSPAQVPHELEATEAGWGGQDPGRSAESGQRCSRWGHDGVEGAETRGCRRPHVLPQSSSFQRRGLKALALPAWGPGCQQWVPVHEDSSSRGGGTEQRPHRPLCCPQVHQLPRVWC